MLSVVFPGRNGMGALEFPRVAAFEGLGESRRRGEVDRAQAMFGPTLSVEISTDAPHHTASRGIAGYSRW